MESENGLGHMGLPDTLNKVQSKIAENILWIELLALESFPAISINC
jgi:hypothetical protein